MNVKMEDKLEVEDNNNKDGGHQLMFESVLEQVIIKHENKKLKIKMGWENFGLS